MICADAVTKTTQAGEADPNFDFAENAVNRGKFITAWNDMVGMTIPIVKWYCGKESVYKEYAGCYTDMDLYGITTKINRFGI
jgi:hypothetical protein